MASGLIECFYESCVTFCTKPRTNFWDRAGKSERFERNISTCSKQNCTAARITRVKMHTGQIKAWIRNRAKTIRARVQYIR